MGANLKPVFLDRDGVINRNRVDYIRSLSQWIPIPGAIKAIVNLSNAGHPVIVLTNQSAIARKYCRVSDVEEIHRHLIHQVSIAGGLISGIYYCPHHPDDGCECRKPRTGMVESARRELDLPYGGYIVGDADSDMELGRRTGLKTVLVLTGRGKDQMKKIISESFTPPWKVTEDISSAVEIILKDTGSVSDNRHMDNFPLL
ncbi:MAG: HAD-IIIA family hydrolase [Candidatus Aegiribacteria sp.]|nr:HAD-IIIA family hydrolase [Candidatus Aegiribacteria sp.]